MTYGGGYISNYHCSLTVERSLSGKAFAPVDGNKGLAKFWLIFTRLAVSFLERFSASRSLEFSAQLSRSLEFSAKQSRSLEFSARQRRSINLFGEPSQSIRLVLNIYKVIK